MSKRLLFYFFFINSFGVSTAFGQMTPIQEPGFSGFQAYTGKASAATTSHAQQLSPSGTVQPGANAQDIVRRQNNASVHGAVVQKYHEVEELMREIRESKPVAAPRRYAPNPERTKDFPAALKHLQDMLSGKAPLSVADAYYTVEHAFGTPYLTRPQYDSIISESVRFIKTWMAQNGLNPKDNYMVHFAIKKFMSERLTVTKTKSKADRGTQVATITHQPFYYDYNDYQGVADHRNTFVTKSLATGFGQCASMPAIYLVLAEKLGVKAYLSFAPHHSFVKHPDNSGYIVNYEPTSNWEISDKWYKDNLFISARAVSTGIYLDTLNSRQVVANCIFDLAAQYIKVDRTGKEDFILDCLAAGTPHFPLNNNLSSLFIYGMHLRAMLDNIMRSNNITSFDELEKWPEARSYYKEYVGNEAYIAKLGYQDMPAGMYEDILKQHEFKGRLQEQMNANAKEKRNLFIKTEQ